MIGYVKSQTLVSENSNSISNTIILQELFENSRTDFSSEVELLSKIDHRSLVKLLGHVDHGNERIIITEYVGNGTLREHLDGKVSTLWKTKN